MTTPLPVPPPSEFHKITAAYRNNLLAYEGPRRIYHPRCICGWELHRESGSKSEAIAYGAEHLRLKGATS